MDEGFSRQANSYIFNLNKRIFYAYPPYFSLFYSRGSSLSSFEFFILFISFPLLLCCCFLASTSSHASNPSNKRCINRSAPLLEACKGCRIFVACLPIFELISKYYSIHLRRSLHRGICKD